MGAEQSHEEAPPATPELLSSQLAQRFATACFTPLELAHFKDNFRTLADTQDGLQYWREETLGRFLALPDALAVGSVVFQMASYLGAFPFPSLAPAILTREALVKVVVIMTERYSKVLKRGGKDRLKLLFRSMAVYDRRASSIRSPHPAEKVDELRRDKEAAPESAIESPQATVQGFDVDRPHEEDESDDDDALALAALESLDAIEVYPAIEKGPHVKMLQAQIPPDNFRRLLMFMLVIATLESQENLSQFAGPLLQARLGSIQRVADSILWTFCPEDNPGISWGPFRRIVNNSLPYLFDGFNPLFEHFLFSKNLDLHKHKADPSPRSPRSPGELLPAQREPLLPRESEILDLTTLSQLSFFIKSSEIFRHLRLLYAGSDAGFSINSISHKILNWRAPTILLVAGTRLDPDPVTPRERSFSASLPPKRFPDGTSGNQPPASATTVVHDSDDNASTDESPKLVFGAYLSVPWKQTPKTPLTDSNALLFQLRPLHDVFRASEIDTNHFTLTPSGLGFGCPPPAGNSNPAHAAHRSGITTQPAPLGAVSLWLDANLEYGVFTHAAAGGGSYAPSRAGRGNWQERFAVESLEVWGCGGDEEAARQRQAWAWEEREAEARRAVRIGKGDRDADYALLELAGLVGQGQSGGSMV